MDNEMGINPVILVVEDVHETRDGIEKLLKVPIVGFDFDEIAAGAEVAIGKNVHITHPDNFNQLRDFIARLLRRITTTA
jgi:hypothetical protein